MEAILKLYRSGLSRAEIAQEIRTSPQLIGMYERFVRFPNPEMYRRLIELANSRGLTLLATDFAKPEPADPELRKTG